MYIYICIYIYIYIYICNHENNVPSRLYVSVSVHEVHDVPKCMSCHKATVAITGRAHYFRDCIYMCCGSLMTTYIYIYIYIYIFIYIYIIYIIFNIYNKYLLYIIYDIYVYAILIKI